MDHRGRIIIDWQTLAGRIDDYRARGSQIVFANGAFDVLHAGHIRYLEAAAAEGDLLVVGINSDESIRQYKDPGRPLQPLADRMEIVAALRCVDLVTCFDQPTCDAILEVVRPHVHAKGPDYTPENLPEWPTLRRLGIRLANVGGPKERSSSAIIRKAISS